MRRFMQVFFRLLYHPFAFTYDLVAWVVSFGHWKDWVYSIVPFLEGTRILELGHGPGHLQRLLLDLNLNPVAMDESAQMATLAKRRLGANQKLARGLAQQIPFAPESFDSIVATFPTEYIIDPRTLSEAKRVLRSRGRLIVLPVAMPKSGFLQWLYKVTGESPAALNTALEERFKKPFGLAGFQTDVKIVELKSSVLMVVVAEKR
ncbi:MAG: methyltransferase domain-containing protein [Chloroflexi bacterium]|nr:methyltransferase domain-containing protein [Chloroflexota bacterium]